MIGSAIALNLLFGLPMAVGVCLTAADVLVVLYLQQYRFRMATHGHHGIGDVIHGQTVDAVRHKARMPVLLLRKKDKAKGRG